ncbi:hydroxymethylbilane synthase [Desertivirga xinjiangensis]|uniref:hydroxymethylbilane synthase n=1 Tax=Desertivirga xinjiangensis TaxID=539206 RepID=UPI00210E7262
MNRKVIIGTRGSDLALWQANYVKDQLAAAGLDAELKIIKTQGDSILNLRLDKLEGKGFFTKELEEGLLNGSIDIAVHSHKDLPTQNPPGLKIAAVSDREDPHELLLILKDCVDVKQKLSVKFGGMVGTSSNRRKAQLLAVRPDLEIEDLRGNVPTRIQKLRDEDYDAIMIAKAGVERLGIDLSEFYVEELEPMEFIPAPAQGVLAIQIREADTELFDKLQAIHNADVAEQIAVERSVLNMFNGGCHMPLGCYCRKENNKFQVWTSKAETDESFPDRHFIECETTEGLAEKIVAKFSEDRSYPKSVFITRDIPESSYLSKALKKHKIEIEGRSLIRTFPIINKLDSFILRHVDWIFFSSKNAIEYFFKLEPEIGKKTRLGVIGRASEEMLRRFGRVPDFNGEEEGIDTADIATEFAEIARGRTVLFPGAKESLRTVQKALSEDTKLIDLPVYETVIEEHVEQSFADVLIFTSPSNVEAYFAENLLEPGQKVICIGRSTGKMFDDMGVKYTLPYSPDEIGLAEAVFAL